MPKGDGLTYEQRFWTKVRKLTRGPLTNGSRCWIWEGGRNGKNYGYFWMDGKNRQAYVVAYEFEYGERPPGKELDHVCRNPPCVNYDHVEPVTRRVNQLRGPTTFPAMNAAKTRCPRGHPYDLTLPGNRRWCSQCRRENARRLYHLTPRPKLPPKRTHCTQGHPFASPDPRCKTCYKREWKRRKVQRAL